MSIGERPHYKLTKKIDEFINSIDARAVRHIYGGQTSKGLETRRAQHQNENNRFIGLGIYAICETTSSKQTVLLEGYLIQKLSDKFGDKCLNDKNKDGTVAQRGGAGMNPENKKHVIYVMY